MEGENIYTNAQKKQENSLGGTPIVPILKMSQSGTIITKFDVQEIKEVDNDVTGFKNYLG